ncbi:MAG TPA: AraC family transcriptional regulator [Gaiellaceae bacterium]|jgi:AraC-like DNA-binding protein
MRSRLLFSSPLVEIAECVHPLRDGTWEEMQSLCYDVPLVVFPRLPVRIRHEGSSPVLAGPNVAMFYNPDVPFRREPRHPLGDHYVEFLLRPSVCAELETRTALLRDGRLRETHAPTSQETYLQQHLLTRHLRAGAPDPLLVEETALWLLGSVLADDRRSARPLRERTRALHHDIAEAAKEVIGATLTERLSLAEIAKRVDGPTPTHLAHIFRSETGFGLHEYRLQLRLRTALDHLDAAGGALTALALKLGFASHSHFTVAFRREFGVPPSMIAHAPDKAWRTLDRAGMLAA